jgi:hypothetical protein
MKEVFPTEYCPTSKTWGFAKEATTGVEKGICMVANCIPVTTHVQIRTIELHIAQQGAVEEIVVSIPLLHREN